MKKKTIFFIAALVLGVFLFGNSIYQTGIGNIVKTLKEFSVIKFLIFASLSFANFYLYSLRWELIVKALFKEKKISSFGLFLHRMAGFALSYVTPSAQLGGEPLRLMMLADEGVPENIGTKSIVIDKTLELSSLFLFITCGIFAALIEGSVPLGAKFFLFVIGCVMLFGVSWFYYASIKNIGFFSSILKFLHVRKIKKLQEMEHKLYEFEQEMNTFYHKHRNILLQLVIISVITTSFLLLEHFLVARFMGVNLSLFQTFLASTIPYVAYLIPVPGGIGVLESGHAAVFAALGVNINAFVFVFIIRLRDFIFVIVGLVHASKRGLSMMKTELKKDYEDK